MLQATLMTYYNFSKDILEGRNGEDIVINYILYHSPHIQLLSNLHTYHYDAILHNTITDRKIKIEIKTDYYCKPDKDTGNMFIEYECRGKDSGINTTQSDVYMYYYIHLNELWGIPTYKLKSMLYNSGTDNKDTNSITKVSNGGDYNSNTKGYLVKREEHRDCFNVMILDKNIF